MMSCVRLRVVLLSSLLQRLCSNLSSLLSLGVVARAIHLLQASLECKSEDAILSVDFFNAFNTLRRDVMLQRTFSEPVVLIVLFVRLSVLSGRCRVLILPS